MGIFCACVDGKKNSLSKYVKKNVGKNLDMCSNGETAMKFFVDRIGENALYLLDEPTTGLHFEDIRVLMNVVNRLVDKGNTVIIIEHNLDVIKLADYIIDMGPEGGRDGGMVMATGTPEEVVAKGVGHTAEYLKKELER